LRSIPVKSAEDLETQYGEVVRALGNETAFKLKKALYSRAPPLDVTEGVLKQWILKYRLPDDAVSISGAEDFEKKYGAAIRHLVPENRTDYKFMMALRALTPPLYVTKKAAKDWLHKYGSTNPVTQINSAGELEMRVGQRIREDDEAKTLGADRLANWLYASAYVSASAKVCQTWLSKEWSSSGKLLCPVSVEEELGDRLRLPEYTGRFADDANATRMAEDLAEGQPPVSVTALTLRQWYTK
jgi:hypothetical protein